MGDERDRRLWVVAKPFVNGGLAATIGITLFNPVDVMKTRIQIAGGGSPFRMAAEMVRTEGFMSLYAGLSAQYLRAWTYQTARLGAYRSLVDAMQPEPGTPPPLTHKAFAGLAAGAFGALIGNPAELAIVRMQSDKTLPEELRRNYRHVGDALVRVVRSEGVLALWTGSSPTILRAMALNCGALASYDQTKELVDNAVGQRNSRVGVGVASLLSGAWPDPRPAALPGLIFFVWGRGGMLGAGVVGSVFSLPLDFVKMQIQRMKPDKNGVLPYSGPVDCFVKTLRAHGPLRFYAGAVPGRSGHLAPAHALTRAVRRGVTPRPGLTTYTVRIAPMITLTWLILEQIAAVEEMLGL